MRNVREFQDKLEKLVIDLRYKKLNDVASWQLRQLYNFMGDELRRRNHIELHKNEKPDS